MNPVLLDLVHCYTERCCFSQSVRGLLGSLGVALHTQDLAIQRIAAIFICFYGERASTVLTAVTLEVEVLVKSYHSDRLLAARGWNNGFITAHTHRGETPVVILDTVGVVVVISDKGCPLEYTRAGAAAETVGVETLSNCLQHTVCNLLPTSRTHSQGAHVAVLTLWRTIPVIELHALQGAVTGHATEAGGVEEFIHGPHCWLSTGESLTTFSTNLCRRGGDEGWVRIHVSNEVLGHPLQLLHFFHVQRNPSTCTRNWARG